MKIKLVLVLILLGFSACGTAKTTDSSDSSVSVLFLGDTHFGESYEIELENRYSMDQFSALFDVADLTIVNLETPLTTLTESPYESEKDYIHWSDPEQATLALQKYGFDAFSLGNNHTLDYGASGLEETLDALGGAGFDFFGAGENEQEASAPFETEAAGLNFAVFGGFEDVSSYEKMDFYAAENSPGVYSITQEATLDSIRRTKEENPDAFVVIFPHWGDNYKMKDSSQEEWAHAFIDAGADLVIGHGAHLFQEVEEYEGKTIVYGLGNFVFNAPGRYQKLDAAPYSATARLVVSGDAMNLHLYPIFSDNLITEYEPRFVMEEEFNELSERADLKGLAVEEDEIGFYFEIPLE